MAETDQNPVDQGSFEELIEQVKSSAEEVLAELEAAAEALRDQRRLPSSELAESIGKLRSSFGEVWRQVGDSAQQVGMLGARVNTSAEPDIGTLT